MKFSSFSLAAVAASLASAEYHRCAVENPPAEQITALNEAARLGAAKQEISRVAARNVPVYVHVVSTQAKRSRYTQAQVNNQIAVMNDAYSGMGITFSLKSTDFTVNAQWAAADLGSSAERSMKAALKKGRYSELDLYFASDIPGGTLGWCYFPVSNPSSSDLALDGCVNLADSMPGGAATNFNEGATATHEVGHWLGLYHVFQGGCASPGDSVSDTPPQKTASSGCPVGQDSCLDRFTAGQVTRATSLFDQLRAGK